MPFYQCITEFIFIENEPRRSDIIFVPGGNYPDAAERAAELYHAGYAPYVMPSGKYSILRGRFAVTEAGIPAEGRNSSLTDRPESPKAAEGGQQTAEERQQAAEESRQTDGGQGKEKSVPDIREGNYKTECDYLCDVLRGCGVPERAILREERATYTYENAVFSRKRTRELGLSIGRAILCCQAFHARRCLMYYQEQFPNTEFLVCPVVTKGVSRENWHLTRQGVDTVLGELERCGGQFHEIMYAKLPPEKRAGQDTETQETKARGAKARNTRIQKQGAGHEISGKGTGGSLVRPRGRKRRREEQSAEGKSRI